MNKKIYNFLMKLVISTAIVWLCTMTGAACKLPDGAYIHIGDVAVYLLALVMPLPIAIPAAAVGCAIADATLGSVNYIFATLIIKAVTVVAVKVLLKLSEKPLMQDILVCLGGVVTVCCYYVADVLKALDNTTSFIQAMLVSLDPVMYNVLQALICAVIYVFVSGFVRAYLEKKKIKETKQEQQQE